MADREKVIKAVEDAFDLVHSDFIGTDDFNETEWEQNKADALSLLKEQEAVTIKKTKEHGFGVYGGICPKCRNWIQSAHSFCGFCGQEVKWE